MKLTPDEIEIARNGGFITIGNKRYGICARCDQVVCVNKRFFGDTHFCIGEEVKEETLQEKSMRLQRQILSGKDRQ